MISLGRYNKFFKLSSAFLNIYSSLSQFSVQSPYVRKCVFSTFDRATKLLIPKRNTHHSASINDDDATIFKRKLFKLHEKFEKREVNVNYLNDVIQYLETDEYDLSQSLGVMLLQCCGNMMYNVDVKKRQSLCERVWKLLKEKNLLTIHHYCALLQTYIDNTYFIDPNKFLQEMTVTPDYNTYRLLLRLLSVTATTASVNDFLVHMRKEGFIFDEEVYGALIYSYSVDGDLKSIEEVIDSMQQENIEPSDTTRNQIIYALAKIDDIESLIETLTTKVVPLSDIMKLVKFLSLEKNGGRISDILTCVKPLTKCEEDVLASIVQLVHKKYYSDAYRIVTEIPIIDQKVNSVQKALAFCFVKEMINSNTDYKVLLEFIIDLAVNHQIPEVWRKAVQLAVQMNKETLALKIFEEMKANGIVVQSSYYWPLLISTHKHGEETDVYSIMGHMMGQDIQLDFNTVYNHVIPYIDTSNPIETVQKMSNNGIPPAYTVPPLMRFLLDSNRAKESLAVCKKFKKKVDCQLLLDSLILNYKRWKNIDICIRLLFELSYNGRGFAGTFLRKVVEQPEFGLNDVSNLIKFLTAMKQVQAIMSVLDVKYVEEHIFKLKLTNYDMECIPHLLIDVTSNADTDNYNSGACIHPSFMNIDQLKVHLFMLKTKGLNTRGCIRRLLMASCKANDIQQVNELVKEIGQNNIEWSPGMKVILFNFYTRNLMIMEALIELQEIKSMFPNFLIDNFKIIDFATLLVKENKVDEALGLIKECVNVSHKTKVLTNCLKLLNLLAEHSNFSYVRQMTDLLIQNGYCENNDVVLKCLLTNSMLKNDIEITVNEFKRCVKKYNKTPAKQEILTELMKQTFNSRAECGHLLDDVHRVLVNVHGKDIATVNLAISLVQCGRIDQLQSLLKNNCLSRKALLQEFKYLPEDDIVKACVTMLEIGGEVLKTNLEPICNLTLTVYTKRGASKSAAKLREKMIEKGVQPSLQFEAAYNALMTKYELPFSINNTM